MFICFTQLTLVLAATAFLSVEHTGDIAGGEAKPPDISTDLPLAFLLRFGVVDKLGSCFDACHIGDTYEPDAGGGII